MSVLKDLQRLTPVLQKSSVTRFQQVFDDRQKGGIERVVRNHLHTQNEAAKACGVVPNTFKRYYQEMLDKGLIEPYHQEGPKKLFSLNQMHEIMDYMNIPKWSDTHNYTHVVNIQNQKGGTGKSSLAVNAAAALALPLTHRIRVLMIDLDPQGSLRVFLAPQADLQTDLLSAVDIMLGDEEEGAYAEYKEAGHSHEEILKASILESHIPNLHILPAFTDDERFSFKAWMHYAKEDSFDHVRYLKEKIIDVVKDDYDVILIDTGPQINPLVWAAQYACNGMLVPVTPHQLDWSSTSSFLRNLPSQLVDNLPNHGENINWLKVAVTNYNVGKDSQIANTIRTDLGLGGFMMSNDIVNSAAFEAAAKHFCTVMDIKKVEGLCPDKQLQDAQMSVEAFTRELMSLLSLAEHQANTGE